MQYIGIQAHTLTLAIPLATFCAFEWRSNLKIDRVMVILRFDLLFDLVTYLFDLWPKKMIYPCVVLHYICGLRLVIISQKLRPVSLRYWTVTLSFKHEPSKHDINGPFVVSVKATNGRNGSMTSHFLSQMARFSVAICLPFKACHEPAVNGPLKASHFTAI